MFRLIFWNVERLMFVKVVAFRACAVQGSLEPSLHVFFILNGIPLRRP